MKMQTKRHLEKAKKDSSKLRDLYNEYKKEIQLGNLQRALIIKKRASKKYGKAARELFK